jgi:hypothetical protein
MQCMTTKRTFKLQPVQMAPQEALQTSLALFGANRLLLSALPLTMILPTFDVTGRLNTCILSKYEGI